MAGANYMGGRRNTARAKAKDVTGRMQKGHFMRQKHQILVRGLRDYRLDDEQELHSIQPGRIKEIGFAHATKDLHSGQSDLGAETLIQPRTQAKGLFQPSSSPGLSRQSRIRRSKILEDLDINDPSGLKATMRRILHQPDLAGLSRANIRPLPLKLVAKTGVVAQSPRKRQKTSEHSSNTSSSSFHYDSPTGKGLSGRPLLFINRDQPKSASLTLARSSSAPAHKTSIGNNSFDSSSDRFSTARQTGSASDHLDSGFSELQFTDELELEDQEHVDLQPDISGDDAHQHCLDLSSSLCSSNDKFSRKLVLKVSQGQSIQRSAAVSSNGLMESRATSRLFCHASPRFSKAQENAVPQNDYLDTWLMLDRTPDPPAVSKDTLDQLYDVYGCERYGVGYVPPDPNVRYKPFVPLATMLPSYSDDDDGEFDEDVNVAGDSAHDEAMEIDNEHTDYPIHDDSQQMSLFPASTMSRSQYLRSQVAFETPPRRFTLPPVSKSRFPPRPRFSLAARDSVCSILQTHNVGANGNKDLDSRYSQKIGSSSPVRYSSSLMSSKSPTPLRTHHSSLHSNEQPHYGIGSSQYQADASSLSTLSAARHTEGRSISPSDSGTLFIDPLHARQTNIPTAMDSLQDDPSGKPISEVRALTPIDSKVFAGPDLFGGDEDED